jgi:K+-transporting ATPase ATPase C chain
MVSHFRPALVMLFLFTALTGIVYPLAMTGMAQALMPAAANGSLERRGDTIVGSRLIGQQFASDKYFHARPSAAGDGYNAASSAGSNFGPLSQKFIDRVKTDIAAIDPPSAGAKIPADAVTASGSGLDPHISPAFAELQIKRIATARGVAEDRVRQILADTLEGPIFGIIGEFRFNVLALNLALDAKLAGTPG